MRIASLEPYITELLQSFDIAPQVVGVSARCKITPDIALAARVTKPREGASGDLYLDDEISKEAIDIDEIRRAKIDTIVASIYGKPMGEPLTAERLEKIQAGLSDKIGYAVKLVSYAPLSLEDIYEGSEKVAKRLKIPSRGSDLGRRAKAQLMDWGDNFYERMKNKRVTFLASIEPLALAGFWIPEMIGTLSALSQIHGPLYQHKEVAWQEILEFRPDVIVVAPQGKSLKQSMATFKVLEKLPGWEDLPAVKRGEVTFSDGDKHFYSPGLSIISSFGIMVSAIAGLESGYITPRDSFYRLRWLELQRHRL